MICEIGIYLIVFKSCKKRILREDEKKPYIGNVKIIHIHRALEVIVAKCIKSFKLIKEKYQE